MQHLQIKSTVKILRHEIIFLIVIVFFTINFCEHCVPILFHFGMIFALINAVIQKEGMELRGGTKE